MCREGKTERDSTRTNGVRSVCFLEVKLGSDCVVSFVRAVALLCKCVRSSGHRVRSQCLDDTNGTIGKVENEEEKEKEHNCVVGVVVVTRTNVVDPVAAATTKQIGDERTKDDY